MKRALVIFVGFLLALSLCACGRNQESTNNPTNEVPDMYIDTYIEQKCNENDEDISQLNITKEHNFDSASHIDTVMITLTEEGKYGSHTRHVELKYQYDKSSDLWNLFASSKWPRDIDSTLVLYASIIGEYDFDIEEYTNFHGNLHLNILSFDSNVITVEYTADGTSTKKGPMTDRVELPLISGSGTFELGNSNGKGYFALEMEPPEGWYSRNDITYVSKDYAGVDVTIDIHNGLHVVMYDSIYHK